MYDLHLTVVGDDCAIKSKIFIKCLKFEAKMLLTVTNK